MNGYPIAGDSFLDYINNVFILAFQLKTEKAESHSKAHNTDSSAFRVSPKHSSWFPSQMAFLPAL